MAKKTFKDLLLIDTSLLCDWSVFTAQNASFNFKGIDFTAATRYSAKNLQPGLGVTFRYNHSNKMFQIPVVASMNFNDYIKVYAGPVFSFTN